MRSIKIVAILAAILFWFYVQATINPIRTVSVTVPVQIYNMDVLEQGNLDYRKTDNVVSLEIRTRKQYESMMTADNITASLDLADLDLEELEDRFRKGDPSVLVKLDVKVNVRHLFKTAYDVTRRNPPQLYVSFYPVDGAIADAPAVIEPGQTTLVLETTTTETETETTSSESSSSTVSIPATIPIGIQEQEQETVSETQASSVPVGMPSVIEEER
ncbi:MAG TPA: hypothetical protein GX717_07720 [Clostridiaceae bacterium]|nr:hypothetical protein [Clostridiaceae bacterium]